MKTLKYKCTLLSDIIINVNSASEGINKTLDFIPGSNFMGIAAAELYHSNDPDTMLIVHSGKVKFGDAHPLVGKMRSLRVPLSMYYPKTESIEKVCYLHHAYDRQKDEHKMQLKQCRDDFYAFFPSLLTMEKVNMDKVYSLKSAYDRERRRAADEQLFGYESMPEGMVFCFKVECPSDSVADKINTIMCGRKHIGRSRTAQYGLVQIEEADYEDIPSVKTPKGEDCIVYAESRLIFYDENGMPALNPSAKDLGFEDGLIDWSKSQIRTFMYSPWNQKRKSYDFDRCGIEKGSVIYVKQAAREQFDEYVGVFNNEGFGKVIYNPDFLFAEPETNGKSKYTVHRYNEPQIETIVQVPDSPLIRFLNKQKAERAISEQAYGDVNRFVEQNALLFKGKEFASQWGQIRKLANKYSDYETLINKIDDYLNHGVAAEKWEEKGRKAKLDKFIDSLDSQNAQYAIINLAAEMAKKCR